MLPVQLGPEPPKNPERDRQIYELERRRVLEERRRKLQGESS
jgi:hypothetical protein